MRRLVTLMSLVCLLVLWTIPAQAERRVALVIGNSAYKVTPLKNPVNDAKDMVAALKALGFEVTLLTDATHQQMDTAVREFGAKLQKGGVGLFFYAGHGVQVSGENYLVPIDSSMAVEADVKYGSLNAGKVLAQMEDAGNELNIVILDACRTNPFARSFRSAEQGLARMDAPKGSLIAYATAPGKVAADGGGGGRNSPYTSSLLRHMRTPGLKLEDTLKRVRVDVMRSTSEKQVPWDLSSLTGDFYFSQLLAQPLQAASALVAAPVPVEKKDKTLGDVFAGLFKKSESQPEASPQQVIMPPAPQSIEQQEAKQAADAELLVLQSELVKQEEAAKDAKSKAERKKIDAEKAVLRKRIESARLAKERAEAEQIEAETIANAKGQTQQNAGLGDSKGGTDAQPGDTPAIWYSDGRKYLDRKDFKEAATLMRKAAEKGHPEAQVFLGSMHERGYGVNKNFVEALFWVKKSYLNGSVEGTYQLSRMYRNGIGVKINQIKSNELLTEAADKGHIRAQNTLSNLYFYGDTMKKNHKKAFMYAMKAAVQGDPYGQYLIGSMYADGNGVVQNVSDAISWYEKAAVNGDTSAMFALGNIYAHGKGVKEDHIAAYVWYSVASASAYNGDETDFALGDTCAILRDKVAKRLNASQLAEAQRLAANWRPKTP